MIENLCNFNIYDLRVGKDFLIYKTEQTIKDKIDKSDNTKIKKHLCNRRLKLKDKPKTKTKHVEILFEKYKNKPSRK